MNYCGKRKRISLKVVLSIEIVLMNDSQKPLSFSVVKWWAPFYSIETVVAHSVNPGVSVGVMRIFTSTLPYPSLVKMSLGQWTIRLDREAFWFCLEKIVHCRESVKVKTQMTLIEWILEYCSLDPEPSIQLPVKYQLTMNRPSPDRIVFENMFMSHSKKLPPPMTLHHIPLPIEPSKKMVLLKNRC